MTDAAIIEEALRVIERNRETIREVNRRSAEIEKAARRSEPAIRQALRQLRRAGFIR